MELLVKLVYWGAAQAGKTTNLRELAGLLPDDVRGRLISLGARSGATELLDLLPVFVTTEAGVRLRVRAYAVPGAPEHRAARRTVLAGAHAVAFVADGRVTAAAATNAAWVELDDTLRRVGLVPEATPIVVQLNKLDLPGAPDATERDALAARLRRRLVPAAATRGEGVVETFLALVSAAIDVAVVARPPEERACLSRDVLLEVLARRLATPARTVETGGVR